MKFKHAVDMDKGIVIVKAVGNLSVIDILYEIQRAIISKRGKGIPRRIIDLSEDTYDYSEDDVKLIFDKMRVSANILKTEQIAFIIKEYPSDYDVHKIADLYRTERLDIGVFTCSADALCFLNQYKAG